MRERQVRRLAVVQGEGLVGIVAQADIPALIAPGEAADTLRELSEPAATQAARGQERGGSGSRRRVFRKAMRGNGGLMASRNLLVVVFEDATGPELRKAIAERADGPPHVRVVAPTRTGLLEWLATDEDRARSEAEVRALERVDPLR
jgi:CBS domain-containing protein